MNTISNIEDDKIIQRIINFAADDNDLGHIPQPMFIIGNHGTGKSTLLKSLVSHLNEKWPNQVQILDGKSFFSSHDIIQNIEGHDYDTNMPISNTAETERRIVIIDDLDYFFKRTSFDDQYVLRSYLNHEYSPLIIATLSEVNDSLADYRAPFFEGVRLIYVPPLDTSVLDSMKISTDTRNRILKLLEYLPPVVASVKMASSIVAISDTEESDLMELIKRMSPLYRNKLEDMPVYSQKILYFLAKLSIPATLSDLRESTGLPSGILSTYLRQLVASNVIRKTNPEKKGTPYEINDKLFSRWLSDKLDT